MISLFALTTRGLENVAAEELQQLPDFICKSTSYRRVTGEYKGDLRVLLMLRTVDDLFLQLAEWPSIAHTRDMLAQFSRISADLPLSNARETCSQIRSIPAIPRFSISASFVGKRNYSSDEIKQACAIGITRSTGWTYSADDRVSDINLRVFIEHESAIVGMRLAKMPLHERDYKQQQIPGSLKPPVAAAMLQLANTRPGDRVVDPCCGAGTILIEAFNVGAVARGGDIDPDAIAASCVNSNPAILTELWDARHLPLNAQSADVVATNLPWDRQVQLTDNPSEFYSTVCKEIERILAPQGRVAILTSLPELLNFERLEITSQIEISLFGQRPVIALFR